MLPKIKEKLEKESTYKKTLNSDGCGINIWVSKTRKIDYNQLYKAMIAINKELAETN